jgi:4-carboxymuconolactone decarboxylase
MARVKLIPRDEMTDEQRSLNDSIAALRSGGQAGGPYGILLHNPALAEKAVALGNHLRRHTSISFRLSELAILVTARAWDAQYEWRSHEKHARNAGLEEEIIDAIKHRRSPPLTDDADRLVYDLATELLATKVISDATYARAIAVMGEQAVIELVAIIGFYTMVAMIVVGFEADVPGGVLPLPV